MPKQAVSSRLTIPDWNAMDRPREKFMQKGAEALSDAELVAILLRSGTREESAVDVAKRMLAGCDNQLNALADMSLQQMTRIAGIGEVKALTLLAAFELGARRRAEKVAVRKKIRSSEDIRELMYPRLAHLNYEEFWTIYINKNASILAMEKIGKGGIDNTAVDVRLILHKAVEINATGFFLCHNHPTGNVRPSADDIRLTNKIKDAAGLFNMMVLDHIIIGREDYFSFHGEGML